MTAGHMATRLARMPAAHFVVVGAALFALAGRGTAPGTPGAFVRAREPVVVTAARVAELRTRFAAVMGAAPTAEQLRALIDQEIDDDVLYHEARARGLDENDRHIRMRLVDKARWVTEDEATDQETLYREGRAMGLATDDPVVRGILIAKMRLGLAVPGPGETDEATEPELLAYRDAHRDRFTRPAGIAFTHVFLSRRRGDAALDEARRLLERLRAGTAADTGSYGDAFPLGDHVAPTSRQALAGSFGEAFAAQVMTLEPGVWSGPLASTYGWHLVRVERREETALPPLDAIRNQLRYGVRAERRERRVQEALRRLRAEYDVRIEDGPQVATRQGSNGGLL